MGSFGQTGKNRVLKVLLTSAPALVRVTGREVGGGETMRLAQARPAALFRDLPSHSRSASIPEYPATPVYPAASDYPLASVAFSVNASSPILAQ